MISKATAYNWRKLGSETAGKLVRRANKTCSARRVVAAGYLDYAPAHLLLDRLSTLPHSIGDIMYSLCVARLRHDGLWEKEHVKAFFSTLPKYRYLDIACPDGIWDSPDDVLGFIYQSSVAEGERNRWGLYYTGRNVVEYMLRDKVLHGGDTFLDPCCGSGAFLLAVKAQDPSCLYGFDIDPIAVMIAATNLLVKFSAHVFVPHVHCIDFLHNDLSDVLAERGLPRSYDNIYTNPPWGTDKEGTYAACYPCLPSRERSSMVIVRSLDLLADNGVFHALLPSSLLRIKTHRDIRRYMLANTSVRRIELFSDRFDGVFTDFFSIKLEKAPTAWQVYDVTTDDGTTTIELSATDRDEGAIICKQLSAIDRSILHKIEALRHDDLTHSRWALGIVTGDNKTKVKEEWAQGMEPVYMGKHVGPFRLHDTTSYISFIPKTFQQCAREELFRAPEKLVYRFIAKYPVVAYDDKQCLCLNSANILIPQLEGISIKSVAALLNSSLYRYYYSMRFPDIKVLKGNLQSLPFPRLTQRQDKLLSSLATASHSSGHTEEKQRELDEMVYAIFGITPKEQLRIQECNA